MRPYCFENQLNCCEVRNVDDDNNDNDDDDDNNNNNNNLTFQNLFSWCIRTVQ